MYIYIERERDNENNLVNRTFWTLEKLTRSSTSGGLLSPGPRQLWGLKETSWVQNYSTGVNVLALIVTDACLILRNAYNPQRVELGVKSWVCPPDSHSCPHHKKTILYLAQFCTFMHLLLVKYQWNMHKHRQNWW